MSCASRTGWIWQAGVFFVFMLVPTVLWAAAPAKVKPEAEVVEMFAGIENGQLEVRLIPRDSAKGQLLVTNKTDKPLSVRLPGAFAGVPVLPQMFPGFQPNQQNQQNSPQRIGGAANQGFPPFGPGMMNLPGGNMFPGMNNQNQNQNWLPGPMFNLAPEQVGKVKVASVCLDHGKANPRAKIPYEIKPIDEVADQPGLAEVVALLGQGRVDQKIAQLAAWHLSNDMSWEELADLRNPRVLGVPRRYSAKQIKQAQDLVEKTLEQGKQGNTKGSESSSR